MRNKNPKSLSEIISILRNHYDAIRDRYKTNEMGVFGSYVRKEQKRKSDIDIFVEFEKGYKTFDNYMDLKFFLEEILDAKVDLVIKTAIREEIRKSVLAEAVYV